ncbi:MAG: MMPL family transporter [Myxococcales bacterium]|nr:MMPL family transporter [Myxococcales bacterium]
MASTSFFDKGLQLYQAEGPAQRARVARAAPRCRSEGRCQIAASLARSIVISVRPVTFLRTSYDRYVAFVCRRRGLALAWLLLACLGPVYLTVQLFRDVRADLQELMPRDSEAARALDRIHERLGSQGHLTVVAHGDDPAANRAFIDALAERLRALASPLIARVQADVRAERAWLRQRAPLLMPAPTFDGLIDDVSRLIERKKAESNPLFVELDGDTADDDWRALEARLDREVGAHDRFPRGYLELPDGKTVVAVVWMRDSDVDIDAAKRLMAVVKAEVSALRPSFPAALGVAYTGDAANFIEEHEAILADLSLTSAVVLVLVTALIALYFRSLRSVVVVLAALTPGLLFAFGLGSLLVGHLNSNTAFLGSIIAGNGINYPLVLLSYFRARRADEPLSTSLVEAAWAALPGTLGAAATASAAYGGLALSSFRGFSQFGYLGGLGMVTTWLWAFLAMPVAVAWLPPPRRGLEATRVQSALLRYFARGRTPQVVAALFLVAGLGWAGLGIARGIKEGVYEMHLEVLRDRRSIASGSASWEAKMTELFGSWVNPVVALVQRPEDREGVARALRMHLGATQPPAIDRVETIASFFPPEAEQQRRLERLRDLQTRIAALPPDAVEGAVKPYLDTWFAPAALAPIARHEIPATLLRNLRERQGQDDRTVLLYPSTTVDYGDGRNMIWLERHIREVPLPAGALVGGPFLFMASIFELVHAEAPRVVLAVFVLVLALLIPLYRRRPGRVLLAAAIVGPVALLSQAMVLAAGVRVNMLNFAAVPITIGVGADYLLNLYGAMDSLKLDARGACARMGGAILLCSLTTIVGYGSLLLAHSGALRTFGWAAVLGEVIAVAAVLLVLPAFWRGHAAVRGRVESPLVEAPSDAAPLQAP